MGKDHHHIKNRGEIAWQIIPTGHTGYMRAVYKDGLIAQGIDRGVHDKPRFHVGLESYNTAEVMQESFALLGAAPLTMPERNTPTEASNKQENIYLAGSYFDLLLTQRERAVHAWPAIIPKDISTSIVDLYPSGVPQSHQQD